MQTGKPALRSAATIASIAAILAVFVLVRLPLLTNDAAVRGWYGDSSIFGLMAKKIRDGKGFDVFYWGQNYMGPLTPAVAAAIRAAVLDPAGVGAEGGAIALRLASMSEIAFGICLYSLGLTRLFGRAIGTAAGVWMALGPPFLIRLSAVPRGPEMSFALGSVLFFLAAGALTRPRPFLDRPVGRFALGLLAGVGWWMNQTIAFVLLPVAAVVVFRSRGRGILTLLLGGFVLGYSPVWMGRLMGWYEPSLGPVVPPWRPSGLPARFVRFLAEDFWRFVGLEGILPPVLLAAVALGALALFFRRVRRLARLPREERHGLDGLAFAGAIATLGTAVFFLKELSEGHLRYLAPILPATLALLLASIAEATTLLPRKIPAGFAVFLSAGLALLATAFLLRQARGIVGGMLLEPDPRAPLRAITDGGYAVCHAGYDTAYTLQFLSDERVRFIPYHSPDRNRTLSAQLRALPEPQCLVTEEGAVRRWLPSDAAQEGGPARRRPEKR